MGPSRPLEELLDLCEAHGISFAQAEEPEVLGEWNWIGPGERASEGFQDLLECVLDACRTFALL